MASYEPEQDPYTWTGSNVLTNKLGLQTDEALQMVEYELTIRRQAQLDQSPINGNFDLAHLQAIHQHIFQDVYEWAGKLRTTSIAKGGSPFAHPDYIESFAKGVFRSLAMEKHLRGLSEKLFVERLSYHFSEINAIHPFREGNGRALQTFLDLLAQQAGYSIDFSGVSKKDWDAAAKESFDINLGPILEVFQGIVKKD